MIPQEVIKKFMTKLAVEEILGSDYSGKTISQISSSIRNSDATKYNDVYKKSNIYIGTGYAYSNYNLTVEDVIKERKAEIFLRNYCGIQLNKKFWISDSGVTAFSNGLGDSGNEDTGAITGSDVNITLSAGEVVNGTTLTSANLQTLKTNYGAAASLASDGNTIIIGTGVEKTDRSVVPEDFINTYVATTSTAQVINTGSRDWVVQATNSNDTINSDGADSISSGAGNDKININASSATVSSGAGNDSISNYGLGSYGGYNVTINGGDGDDTISLDTYSENTMIYYNAGDGTGIYSKAIVNDDITVTVGEGIITLTGAATLETLNINGTEQNPTKLILTNANAAKVTVGAEIITADATARTKAIGITGNALDNSLYGGSGKDSLYGKVGDDFCRAAQAMIRFMEVTVPTRLSTCRAKVKTLSAVLPITICC